MAKRKQRRGISLGTVVMLSLTVAVVLGLSFVMPRLMGGTRVTIDTGNMLQAMNLSRWLPSLTLSEIPISSGQTVEATQQPVMTPVPTMAPLTTGTPVPASAVTAAPTPSPVPTQAPGGSFTMTIGGSVHLEKNVRQSGYYSESKKYDFTEILSLLAPKLQSDLALVPLGNIVYPEKSVSDLNAPGDVMKMLTAAGFDCVALGFEHAYDQGMNGLKSTIAAAKAQNLRVIGAFETEKAASQSSIITLNNVNVALLHYTDGLSNKGAKAIKKDDNAYALPQADVKSIAADIASARAQGAHVVLVSLNWGTSGKSAISKVQRTLAQQLADAGADVIIGSGSRVVQPVEWLTANRPDGSTGRVLCAYSLGCLISDSRKDGNVAGMLLQLGFTCDAQGRVTIDKAAYTPTYVWRYKQDDKYYYRVVASNAEAPDGMAEDQKKNKDRAMANTQKSVANEQLPME